MGDQAVLDRERLGRLVSRLVRGAQHTLSTRLGIRPTGWFALADRPVFSSALETVSRAGMPGTIAADRMRGAGDAVFHRNANPGLGVGADRTGGHDPGSVVDDGRARLLASRGRSRTPSRRFPSAQTASFNGETTGGVRVPGSALGDERRDGDMCRHEAQGHRADG